jgi:hypothetical protein
MKYTLLELTQAVLSSMDSDEINSITDTVESQQVVEVIKTVYDDIISRSDLHSNNTLFNLTASSDVTKPITMSMPESIDRIEWLKYDTRLLTDTGPNWTIMRYLPPESFIDFMHQYDQNESYIESFDHIIDDFTLHFTYRNDQGPTYYTTFDDELIFFDSYDAEVDSTLQSSKTIGFGQRASTFQKLDAFVPDLRPQQFALLLNESKSLAWAELKQTVHEKAEVSARRNWRHLQKTRQTTPDGTNFIQGNHNFDKLPNFARNR